MDHAVGRLDRRKIALRFSVSRIHRKVIGLGLAVEGAALPVAQQLLDGPGFAAVITKVERGSAPAAGNRVARKVDAPARVAKHADLDEAQLAVWVKQGEPIARRTNVSGQGDGNEMRWRQVLTSDTQMTGE